MAAIFFRGHPYIWRTTVRHDESIVYNNVTKLAMSTLAHTEEPKWYITEYRICYRQGRQEDLGGGGGGGGHGKYKKWGS